MLFGATSGIVGAALVAPLITSSGGACGANASGSMIPGVAAVFCAGCWTGETGDRACCCCTGSCGWVGEALAVVGAIVGYAMGAVEGRPELDTGANGSSAMSGMRVLLSGEGAHADDPRLPEWETRPVRSGVRHQA